LRLGSAGAAPAGSTRIAGAPLVANHPTIARPSTGPNATPSQRASVGATSVFWLRSGGTIASKIWFDSVSVHVLPMADFHNAYQQDIVVDFVEHSVHSAPKSVLFCTGQFNRLRGARVVSQSLNGFYDPLDIPLRDWV
jgi:hypothetical protein